MEFFRPLLGIVDKIKKKPGQVALAATAGLSVGSGMLATTTAINAAQPQETPRVIEGKIVTMSLPNDKEGYTTIVINTQQGKKEIQVPYQKNAQNDATVALQLDVYNPDTQQCEPDTEGKITGPAGQENPDPTKETTPFSTLSFILPDRHGNVQFTLPAPGDNATSIKACVQQADLGFHFDDGCDRIEDPKTQLACEK